jgi:hypothetical protein
MEATTALCREDPPTFSQDLPPLPGRAPNAAKTSGSKALRPENRYCALSCMSPKGRRTL